MSPEQLLSSKNVDERSDIWALGVIFYELLIGEPPFVADTGPEIIAQVLQNNPRPATSRRADLPAAIDQIIGRCMRSKVEERFGNVADLAHALMPFAAVEDRESVAAISNVLGVSHLPTGDTMLAAQAPAIAVTQGAPGPSRPPQAGTVQPSTAHNLTLSAGAIEAPRPRMGLWLAVGATVVVAGLGAVVALRPAATAIKPASEVAAGHPPETPVPPAVTLAPNEAAPVIAAASAAPAEAVAPAPAAILTPAAGHGPGHHGGQPGLHPSTTAAPATSPMAAHAAATASAVAANPPPAPTPAPAPAPPPAATATTNFLDMHIR
jgi:serine/threonine-protein kinase